MVQNFQNVSSRKFHKVFHVIAPCECHTENFNTSYDVKVLSDDKSTLITLVNVHCSVCGTDAAFDVKLNKILEGDVAFFGANKTK